MPKKITLQTGPIRTIDLTLKAFKLASPFAMAMRTGDFAHCVEASLVGATAFRRFGVNAEAIPCSIFAVNMTFDPPVQLALGLTRRDIYPRLTWTNQDRMSFDDWSEKVSEGVLPDEEFAMHMAIRVTASGRTFIADPTIGQLHKSHPISVRVAEYVECHPAQKWPRLETSDGWSIRYDDSPRAQSIGNLAAEYSAPIGWINDLVRLMEVAISVQLDSNRFIDALEHADPAALEIASQRIMGLLASS